MKLFTPLFISLLISLLISCTLYANPDTWIQKTSMPAQARAGAVAFALNGFGYSGTGRDSTGTLLNDFWKYDPANDSWSQAASFPGTPRKNAVAFATDTFAFVGTGYDNSGLTKDFYKYDALLNAWTQIADLDSGGSYYSRRDAVAFGINNNGYVVGGYDGTTFYSKKNYEYDGNRDTVWKEKTSFPLPGRRWASGFSIYGFGFSGMGYNYSQEYFNDFWKYDVNTNSWTQIADYPGSSRGYAVSFVINGYAFTGSGFDGALKGDFYRYDLNNNLWTAIASFGGQPTSAAASFQLNGKGYVVGGVDTFGYKNELWEYTPDNIAGINSGTSTNGIQVSAFPNPALNYFEVENLLSGSNYQLKLFDVNGKLFLDQPVSTLNKKVFVGNMKRGMYYFLISEINQKIQPVTGKVLLQ